MLTNKFKINRILQLLIIASIFLPLISLAGEYKVEGENICYDGLVPCGKDVRVGGAEGASGCEGGTLQNIPCQLCHIFVMIKGIVDFLLFRIVPIVAVLLLTAGGVMFVVSRGDPGKLTQAKSTMTAVVVGLVIIFASWVIINTIFTLTGFMNPDFGWDPAKWFEINCAISLSPGGTGSAPPPPPSPPPPPAPGPPAPALFPTRTYSNTVSAYAVGSTFVGSKTVSYDCPADSTPTITYCKSILVDTFDACKCSGCTLKAWAVQAWVSPSSGLLKDPRDFCSEYPAHDCYAPGVCQFEFKVASELPLTASYSPETCNTDPLNLHTDTNVCDPIAENNYCNSGCKGVSWDHGEMTSCTPNVVFSATYLRQTGGCGWGPIRVVDIALPGSTGHRVSCRCWND